MGLIPAIAWWVGVIFSIVIIGGVVGWFARGRLWLAVVCTVLVYFFAYAVICVYFKHPECSILDSLRMGYGDWKYYISKYRYNLVLAPLFVYFLYPMLVGAVLMHFVYKRSRQSKRI